MATEIPAPRCVVFRKRGSGVVNGDVLCNVLLSVGGNGKRPTCIVSNVRMMKHLFFLKGK